MVKATLRCLTGDLVEVTFDGEARIGRSARNELVIPDPVVSAEHARIWYDREAGAFFVEDLKSTNGTEVANRPVTGPERLLAMDVLVLGGEVEVLFHHVPEAAAPPPPPGPPATPPEETPAEQPAPTRSEGTPAEPPAPEGTPQPAPGTRVLSPSEQPLFPGPKGPETIRAAPWQPPPVDPGAARPPDTIVEKPQAPPPPQPPEPGTEKNEG